MISDEWGPWIEHDGKGCPCVGMYVHVELYNLEQLVAIAMGGSRSSWVYGDAYDRETWSYLNGKLCTPIIRYRIRKPRGMKILQQLVENPPKELVKEDA